jgi:hypothetical protein
MISRKDIVLALFALTLPSAVRVDGLTGNPEAAASPAVLKEVAKGVEVAKQWKEAYGDLADPGVLLLVVFTQIFQANLDALFLTLPLLRGSPSLDFYRLTSCARKHGATCMYYGEGFQYCLRGNSG